MFRTVKLRVSFDKFQFGGQKKMLSAPFFDASGNKNIGATIRIG